MNDIRTEVNPSDIVDARIERTTAEDYAAEILTNLCSSAPYNLTFIDGIPSAEKAAIEAELKKKVRAMGKHLGCTALPQDHRQEAPIATNLPL